MKRLFFIATGFLLLFSLLAVWGANNLHLVLSRDLPTWNFWDCLFALLTSPKVWQWFWILEGGGLLITVTILFDRYVGVKKYSGKLIHICDGIDTPETAGNGKYGTARWMSRKEKDDIWTVIDIDRNSPKLRALAAHGRDDLKGGVQ